MATPFGGTGKKVKGKMTTESFPQKTGNYTAKKYEVFFPIITLHTVVENPEEACTSNNYRRGKACGNKCKGS